MSLDWTNAKTADGPRLLAWLTSIGAYRPELIGKGGHGDSQALVFELRCERWEQALRRWRNGTARWVQFLTVDDLCCALGRHVSEVPNDVWVHRKPGPLTSSRTHT